MADINQTVEMPPIDEDCPECDIVIEDGAFDGFEGKTINITEVSGGGMGDVQAGIEFIYNMREHIVDIGVATIYLFTCYTVYLLLKKYIK